MMTEKERVGRRFSGVVKFSILRRHYLRICKTSLYFLIWNYNLTTTLPYRCSSQPVVYIVSPSDLRTGHSCLLVRQLVWIFLTASSISALPANRFGYLSEKCSINDGGFVNMIYSLVWRLVGLLRRSPKNRKHLDTMIFRWYHVPHVWSQ
jgi:hypothetical protein